MNLYESDYWKLTVFLQKHTGLWLFQNKPWKNYIAWIYVYSFTISFMVSMGIRWYNELGVNIDIVIENAIGEIYLSVVFFKLTNNILYRNKLIRLYEKIAYDWKIIKDIGELKVLHRYTEIGSKIVRLYSGYMIIGVAVFLSMPIFSPVLDYIIPLENGTRPKALPYYAEYGIDIEKHYYPMIAQAVFGGVGTISVLVTFDLGFMLIVQHVVALFKIVNFRLSKAAQIAATINIGSDNIAMKDCAARRYVVQAIEIHQTAINYVDIVENCYNIAWLIILVSNMIMVGGGMSILLMKLSRPEESLRYAVVVCATFIHFYYIFLPGQKLINSSRDIFDQCYACNWFNLSQKSKRLIQIMMIRSLKPSELTGGKMFILCMDTYCNMMKTGFSIFTVFNS
ncbi:uncharacterized protein LOC131673694 [Phymastichus coffea]|uniref:uncharacterized protein LOC131673694 n=1 Tax=Phymastichus coffea TaxID=108790 RepID=UPI00273B11CC|nr:uncharacterized protein LOC131673694 [Phymastichus coffea]